MTVAGITVSDTANVVLAAAAVLSPLLSVAILFGRRSADVSSIVKRLDKLDDGDGGEIRERAVQSEKIAQLEKLTEKFDSLRAEFISFKATVTADHAALKAQITSLAGSLDNISRQLGNLATGSARPHIIELRKDSDG